MIILDIFMKKGKQNELNISTFNEEAPWLFSALDNISFIHRDDKELYVHLKRRCGMAHLSVTPLSAETAFRIFLLIQLMQVIFISCLPKCLHVKILSIISDDSVSGPPLETEYYYMFISSVVNEIMLNIQCISIKLTPII